MLTLVAAVLAYDMALEMCDRLSSIVEVDRAIGRLSSLGSLKERSCTRLEKDMMGGEKCVWCRGGASEGAVVRERSGRITYDYERGCRKWGLDLGSR
jgi:hypothetical protein